MISTMADVQVSVKPSQNNRMIEKEDKELKKHTRRNNSKKQSAMEVEEIEDEILVNTSAESVSQNPSLVKNDNAAGVQVDQSMSRYSTNEVRFHQVDLIKEDVAHNYDREPKNVCMASPGAKEWRVVLKQSVSLLLQVLVGTAPVLFVNILFTLFFYLPTVVLSPALLGTVKEYIYNRIASAIWSIAFWLSVASVYVQVFSFHYSKNALLLGIIPAYLLDFASGLSVEMAEYLAGNLDNALNFFSLAFSLLLIQKSKHKEPTDKPGENLYALTKDGTVFAIFKGITTFFILITFLFYNILNRYLTSSFYLQIFYRLILFPFCFNVSKWAQLYFISHLSEEYMDKRLLVNKLCSCYIQFLGRILLSNTLIDSAASWEYVILNFALALLGVASSWTFQQRIRFGHRSLKKTSDLFQNLLALVKARQLAPIQSPNEPQIDCSGSEMNQKIREDAVVCKAIAFRSRIICEEMAIEMHSIIIAPMLMYFIHPITSNSNFRPIFRLYECFFQVSIQLFFELAHNLISVAIEIKTQGENVPIVQMQTPAVQLTYFLWTTYCVLSLSSIIIGD